MTDILFVYFDIIHLDQWKNNIHFGIAGLSSYLKHHKFSVKLIYLRNKNDIQKLPSLTNELKPRFIGFSFTSPQFKYVAAAAELLKKNFDTPIICGGIHSTIAPEEVFGIPEVDMICVGEGELPLKQLLSEKNGNTNNIAGILNRDFDFNNGIIETNSLESLDDIPGYDWELFDYGNIYEPREKKTANFLASRGCPYNCSYCANKILREIKKTSKIRYFSVSRTISELEKLIKNYQIEYFRFTDDILTLDMNWYREFISEYKKYINKPFDFNIRINLITEETIELLKSAGANQLLIGIESGSENYRQNILKRDMSQKLMIEKLSLVRKYKIDIYAFNMIGGPEETPYDIIKTIKINAQAEVKMIQLSIITPYPGSDLFAYCKANKLIKNIDSDSYFEDCQTIINNALPEKLLIFYKNNFFKIMRFYNKLYKFPCYMRHPMIYIADHILASANICEVFPVLQKIIKFYRKIKKKIMRHKISDTDNTLEITEGVGKNF
ncbi:B12-binding domain-containing radical SAM protein [Candidatus Dependentiae bacterium]|nr:B12-binding domain-containing radical SAM protein [Candidatus Dependentiae bacterium]